MLPAGKKEMQKKKPSYERNHGPELSVTPGDIPVDDS